MRLDNGLHKSIVNTSRSLLDFLYRTPTILARPQQYEISTTSPLRYRQRPTRAPQRSRQPKKLDWDTYSQVGQPAQPKPNRIPDIPFERPAARNDPYAELELEGSTITPNERKAFEGLLKLQRKDGASKTPAWSAKAGEEVELDADGRRKSSMPAALRKLAAQQLEPVDERVQDQRPGKDAPRPTVKAPIALPNKESQAFNRILATAKTDADVWQFLQSHIARSSSSISHPDAPADSGLPESLTQTFKYLQTHFPTSSVPLSLLQLLSTAAPASSQNPATRELYNLHLAYAFKRDPPDLPSLIPSLRAMASSKGGPGYDGKTLAFLDSVLAHAADARRGVFGPSLRVLWLMEVLRGAVEEVKLLRENVVEIVQGEALRRAREAETSDTGAPQRAMELS